MEDPIINSDLNPNSLPIPPLDHAHLHSADFFPENFSGDVSGGGFDGDGDDFLFNLDFDFTVDDLTFADGFLIEPENPNSSLSNDSNNPIHGPISSEESNFGPGPDSGSSGNNSDRDVSSNCPEKSVANNGKKPTKRKKEFDENSNIEARVNKAKKSEEAEVTEAENSSVVLEDESDFKKKARLIRNRESAQLSRQRKKQYVEELEDKVRNMHSTISELNGKISYVMAENASLRQQLSGGCGGGGGGGVGPTLAPLPPVYPMLPMQYPWMPYTPYMVKPHGGNVPLVPIPRLKPQAAAAGSKKEGKRKKVASVSLIGLLFFMVFFGGLVPMVNFKYGEKKGNVFMVDSVHGRVVQESNRSLDRNSSEALVASLYVPRNDKLVKIDGNLIIHSVLVSEKAKESKMIGVSEEGGKRGGKVSEETGLAIHGSYPPYPTPGPGSDDWRHPHLDRNQNGRQRALGSSSSSEFTPVGSDGKLQQWFREGLAGPMLSSGMCTEVFQFDISPTPGAIVPATSIANVTSKEGKNSTRTNKPRNRRILHEDTIPFDGHTLNTTEMPQEHNDGLQGNKSSSSMVVSVLVDPREVGDGDGEGVIRSKTMSRIFVVVLIDSVKYVTYSCMLPFMGSGNHLVTT